MRIGVRAWAAAALSCGLLACTALGAQPEQPARLLDGTDRQELERVIARALGDRPVRLAPDALRRDSVLVIERAPARDATGMPLDGRSTQTPERFRLVRQGTHCLLIREATGERLALPHASCAAIAAD